ncbi:glycosyltransferase family 4 protein [Aliikangiella sp. IMCC44653]
MKIIHCCLSCFYIDDFSYQENELIRQNVIDGHKVLVIASTETIGKNNSLVYTEPKSYLGSEGAQVIRLPYTKYLPSFLARKLRMHKGVLSILVKEKPDAVLFHGLCGWELMSLIKYKKINKNVKLYADSHEDAHNSARTVMSKYLLHKLFYKSIITKALPYLSKILCLTAEVKDFCIDMYGIPKSKIEMFYLGGRILDDDEYAVVRESCREKYGIKYDDVLMIQTGKFDRKKKLIESLTAFNKIKSNQFKFFIVGEISENLTEEASRIIESDERIRYLGWKNAEELRALLCASDVYVQPGSQSATMQMSLCCRCATVLDKVKSHIDLLGGTGWLVSNQDDLIKTFLEIEGDRELVKLSGKQSYDIAVEHLDYKKLAKRLEV